MLYKFAVTAFDCVRGTGPAYFRDVCVLVADISGQALLRSAERCDMLVPRTRTRFSQRSFMLQPRSSGTRCLHTCAQPPSVVNSSEMGWRPISSHSLPLSPFCFRAYTTLTLTLKELIDVAVVCDSVLFCHRTTALLAEPGPGPRNQHVAAFSRSCCCCCWRTLFKVVHCEP